jgi:hypothetical protein
MTIGTGCALSAAPAEPTDTFDAFLKKLVFFDSVFFTRFSKYD